MTREFWQPKETYTIDQTNEALQEAIDDKLGYDIGSEILDCEHSYCKEISDDLKNGFYEYANYFNDSLEDRAEIYCDLYAGNIDMLVNSYYLVCNMIRNEL